MDCLSLFVGGSLLKTYIETSTSGFLNYITFISEWIMRLTYLNVIWILFTLFGFIILGFFPATVALFSIMRKFFRGEEIAIFQTFWQVYRQKFWRSQMLGSTIAFILIILYADVIFFWSLDNTLVFIPKVLTISVIFLFSLTLSYIFPVYVHYEGSIGETIKYSFVISIAYIKHSFVMIIVLQVIGFVCIFYPTIILFFGFSCLALVGTFFSHKSFQQIELRSSV